MMFRKTILTLTISALLGAGAMALPEANAISPRASEPRAADAGDDLAIIVNTANPVDNLSLTQLRGIFLAERHTGLTARR